MHIKRVSLYVGAQIAHSVPCLHAHVHCKYEVTESNQTRHMCAQSDSALVLDLTRSCALRLLSCSKCHTHDHCSETNM